MNQAEALYHLQQIDLAIRKAQARLKVIAEQLADSAVVQAAQAQVSAAQAQVSPLQAQVRDLELQIESTQTKQKSTETRLYSGSVKNPKELQDMQNEIESLKVRRSDLEDRLLEAMMALEVAQAALNSEHDQLVDVTAQWEAEHADLMTEKAQIEAEVTELQDKRPPALARVAPDALALYQELRPQKGGQPVALLNGDSCGVCGIQQTTVIQQDVRRGSGIVHCVNCGRILVKL